MDTTIPNPAPKQTRFYVTMKRDSRTAWLSGPYETHDAALARVNEVRERVYQLDPWTWFDAFGTSSITREGSVFPLGLLEKLDAKDGRHAPDAILAPPDGQRKSADGDPGQAAAELEEGRPTSARRLKGE